MAPTVSVVMGVYNAERTLKAAVESILSQSFSDFELIVVNDGSTDKTQEILADFARRDARVRVVTQTNQGLTRSLILGCELASGRYIARQDADDVSMPDRFMQLVQLIQYAKIESFSMSLSNKVMNLSITPNDLQAYESLGLDTSSFNKDDNFFSVLI